MRVLIADDHAIVRQGLKALIEKEPGMKVIAEAQNGEQAVEIAREQSPDIIVMDITIIKAINKLTNFFIISS